jgi:hypothetical protein
MQKMSEQYLPFDRWAQGKRTQLKTSNSSLPVSDKLSAFLLKTMTLRLLPLAVLTEVLAFEAVDVDMWDAVGRSSKIYTASGP